MQIGVVFTGNGTRGVVDKVGLHTVNHLKIGSLCGFFDSKHCIGESLYVAVVGDGNGRHTPLECRFDGGIGGNECVHGGHSGM